MAFCTTARCSRTRIKKMTCTSPSRVDNYGKIQLKGEFASYVYALHARNSRRLKFLSECVILLLLLLLLLLL